MVCKQDSLLFGQSLRDRQRALPVVDDLNCPILFNPQFADDDIVHTAHRVCPSVCLFVPTAKTCMSKVLHYEILYKM